ncbi:GspE/PulE family protein (plasmid) [Ralstonia solanacearum P673]|uniref:GspE/PulE family protein n=1 Tax=Ralstonia solanacearum TaxID=305 RepID=UPI0004B0C13E|nr:GspE/PulE family protein [Ralstonia solanacearum]MCL9850627.1 GspE/PulE family protein [Ralstonia solanacearum]MCL9856644.1 GspE/PulE family protein [Ralstonia solanacearum]MCL9861366.1 GspE/PulE family protein [Ralstonia solanacearum]MCL9866287.1 GspE/PulE family protein [Ralstonia solanacearum]MCL9871015.1 GspE/PulE family protein [Ralstonia solanacearum]
MMAPHTPTLSVELLRQLREASHASGDTLLATIARSLQVDERGALAALAACLAFDCVETAQMFDWTPAESRLPLSRAMQRDCALFVDPAADAGYLAVIHDPFDTGLAQWLGGLVDAPVRFVLAMRADIRAYLAKREDSVRAMESLAAPQALESRGASTSAETLSLAAIAEDGSPIVKIVNSTLYDALKAGASDIHIESVHQGLHIKYRIDGVLDTVSRLQGSETAEQVISRLKVLAELDISERRVPQDGRFKIGMAGREIDLRVSVMPSIHGEDAVLRILDKKQLLADRAALTLDILGFDAGSLAAIRDLAAAPYGMLLVTGPTGSGKTTTLYAAISEIHTGHDKIITIEDPVEYELPGVLQIPVNEKKGLTFARGLRSVLRHDPDKIMVGEIRDAETAEIAVQSALTGHLVLSTVHANSAFDVFNRFTHMGLDPYALTSALNGISAQRLLRNVCERCAVEQAPTATELARLGLSASDVGGLRFRAGRGCGDCRGTGYKGRTAIAEILRMDDALRELITSKAPLTAIKEHARSTGTRFLREAALDLARSGRTTLLEVARVTL